MAKRATPPKKSREAPRVNAKADVASRFARRLAELRAERSETQKQLATRLGMTESVISRLESGEHVPSIATLCRIADGFDLRLDIVFHEHEHEHDDGSRHTHVHKHDPQHAHAHDRKKR